jgi:hypothetical protein
MGLLLLGGIWLAGWLAIQIIGYAFRAFRPNTPARPDPQPGIRRQQPGKDVYRPRPANRSRSNIVFNGSGTATTDEAALAGLHDAFTGAKLNPALGLFQCTTCKVYYHADSYVVLRAENAGRCVACSSAIISSVSANQATENRGRDFNPDVVTLATFRSHFNRVVTFEGIVREVKVSRRGQDYAVMFEQASWSRGLKLVCFRGAIDDVGGARFIRSLNSKRVRVRGLLINHQIFGPEIIVTERTMILDIK